MPDREWRRRIGTTFYRRADPSDIIGAKVINSDTDAVYLEQLSSGRTFIVHIEKALDYNYQIEEYASVDSVRYDYDQARADAGLI